MAGRKANEAAEKRFNEWRRAPVWERAVAFVGLLLLIGVLGFLLREAIWGDKSLPDIVLIAEEMQQNGDDYVVGFIARNEGGSTAADVLIRARLVRDGEVLEEAEATLDFLPSKSERRGGLFFENDPRDGEIYVSAAGYSDP